MVFDIGTGETPFKPRRRPLKTFKASESWRDPFGPWEAPLDLTRGPLGLPLMTLRRMSLQELRRCHPPGVPFLRLIWPEIWPKPASRDLNLLIGGTRDTFWIHVLQQWGRRLEGWPNTAARLAGWRRVTRLVWFCTWWTGRTACLFPYRTCCPDRSCPAASW
jgi:hypothetical protein